MILIRRKRFRRFGRIVCFAFIGVALPGLGEFAPAAGEGSGRASKFGDPEAQAVALRVHAEARAMDRLPQFHYRVESGNGDVATMLDMEECTLPWLKQALDEPISRERWYQAVSTLAWSGRTALWSNYDRKYKNETQESNGDKSRQDWVWTVGDAFGRSESNDHPPSFVFVPKPERLWEGRLMEFAYFRVTPHKFWWGTSSKTDDTISFVAPEEALYRTVGRERFDDELCDVVESAARMERLWIGRESTRLRGVLSMRPGRMPNPFYSTVDIREIAGRPFITNQEFLDWRKEISPDQESKVMAAWNSWKESSFATSRPRELIRFRDYREVAPGVWIPFREDRAWTHPARRDRKGHKFIHLWVAVQEVRTDVDLTDTVEALRPNDGDQIEDQRFGVVLKYKFRHDRTQGELREMADAEKQRPDAIKVPANEKEVQK